VYPTRNEKALEEKTLELSHIHPENGGKYIVSNNEQNENQLQPKKLFKNLFL
jgi:hypothetical protein